MRIIFAGTPEFALPCFKALLDSPHQLIAVYTQPDRPAGRGRKLQFSPVKSFALENQIEVHQPLNFKSDEDFAVLKALNPDVFLTIAYGLILPLKVLTLPRLGCLNVHASLLPRWRGASPIQQAILKGDKETGISIMQLEEGLDSGDVLTQVACPIYPEDTAGRLHDRLAQLAVEPLLATLDALGAGKAEPKKQSENGITYAPKIKKEEAAIDWYKPAVEIERQIRAFNPWPIAYTKIGDELMRIHHAHSVEANFKAQPGAILTLDKKGILVSTAEQALMVETIQFPGGKAMPVADWLNAGRKLLDVNVVFK